MSGLRALGSEGGFSGNAQAIAGRKSGFESIGRVCAAADMRTAAAESPANTTSDTAGLYMYASVLVQGLREAA
jgi:hypothetical protein